ncbi:hypothetical protein PAMP_003501 [Pampus punctatissimus]
MPVGRAATELKALEIIKRLNPGHMKWTNELNHFVCTCSRPNHTDQTDDCSSLNNPYDELLYDGSIIGTLSPPSSQTSTDPAAGLSQRLLT